MGGGGEGAGCGSQGCGQRVPTSGGISCQLMRMAFAITCSAKAIWYPLLRALGGAAISSLARACLISMALALRAAASLPASCPMCPAAACLAADARLDDAWEGRQAGMPPHPHSPWRSQHAHKTWGNLRCLSGFLPICPAPRAPSLPGRVIDNRPTEPFQGRFGCNPGGLRTQLQRWAHRPAGPGLGRRRWRPVCGGSGPPARGGCGGAGVALDGSACHGGRWAGRWAGHCVYVGCVCV